MEIKITKIYENLDPEEFKKDFEIKLEDIYLAKNNPRYTIYNEAEEKKFDEFISADFKEGDQNEVLLDILNSEHDFKRLWELLDSIRERGFYNRERPICLFKKDDAYIVISGNRRVAVLKLIAGLLELPSIEEIQNHRSCKLSENPDYVENGKKNFLKKSKRYDKIIRVLKEIKMNPQMCEVYVRLTDNPGEALVFTSEKHLIGWAKGFKKWERAKFFAKLLTLFPDGLPCDNEKLKNKFSENFYCDWKKIEDCYKNAMFVYLILLCGEVPEQSDNLKEPFYFNNKNILNRMALLQDVSSLEREHSYSQIKKIACEKILKDDDKTSFKQYFSLKFKKKKNKDEQCLLIHFDEPKIKAKDLLDFIYRNWRRGVLTTRPVKKENLQDFIAGLEKLLFGISASHFLKPDELNDIDEWSIDLDNLKNLLSANSEHYKKNNLYDDFLARFAYAENVRRKNKEIIQKKNDILKNTNNIDFDNSPASVFKSLFDQFEKIEDRYLNLKFSIISKFADRLFLWMYYDLIKSKSTVKIQYVKALSETDQNGQGAVTEISLLLRKCIDEFNRGHVSRDVFDKMVNSYTNLKLDQHELDCFYNFVVKRQMDNQWSWLNDFISLPYKFCNHKNFLEILKLFEKVLKHALTILSKIDFEKFSELNEEITRELTPVDHFKSSNDTETNNSNDKENQSNPFNGSR